MMTDFARRNIDSGTPWEAQVGYSRAVRVGPFVMVTGTMAADESGAVIAPGEAGPQTRYVIEKVQNALRQAGAELEHVVRTRIFVTSIDDMAAVGEVHRAFFGDIRPCTTMVEVSGLAAPEAVVEIEMDAIVG